MALDETVARPARPHARYPCFDGVRALAALMVVVYHAVFFNSEFVTRGGAFLGTLNAGVWIFFVTSGFLLYLPFTASHLTGADPVDPRGYAIRLERSGDIAGALSACERVRRTRSDLGPWWSRLRGGGEAGGAEWDRREIRLRRRLHS